MSSSVEAEFQQMNIDSTNFSTHKNVERVEVSTVKKVENLACQKIDKVEAPKFTSKPFTKNIVRVDSDLDPFCPFLKRS